MKKFPKLVHLAYEDNVDGEEDYLVVYTGGVSLMEPGQRYAIYKLVGWARCVGRSPSCQKRVAGSE